MTVVGREVIEQKVNLFFKERLRAFVRLNNKHVYSGLITYIGADFFYIDDKIIGKTPIFFLEVENIEIDKKGAP